jgi:CRP-like cAMP-binding protein
VCSSDLDVIALDEVSAFRIAQERFRELLITNDRIALRFYRTFVSDLTRRLRDTNRKLQQKSA